MASLEDLNDSQRAILQLLLKQGRSYDEIAAMLKSSSSSVQSRAHEAVAAIGPATPDIGTDRRREIADYLLGQQAASRRAATREYLEDSATGRAWSRAVAGALRPIGGDALPEIPAEPAEVDEAFDALDRRTARHEEVQRSSRLGTALLFVAGGIVVAVALILALGIFSGDGSDNPRTTTVTRTAPTEAPVAIAEGALRPPKGSAAKVSGQMGIIQYPTSNRFKLLIAAKGLQPAPNDSAYGVWLYTSTSDKAFVGFPKGDVDAKGELDVVADLSPETRTYREVLLTLERVEKPTRPGEVIARGELVIAKPQTQPAPPVGQTQTAPQTQTTP